MSIDYTPLDYPVTRADIDTYRTVFGGTYVAVPQSIGVILKIVAGMLVIGLVAALIAGLHDFVLVFVRSIFFYGLAALVVVSALQVHQQIIRRRAKAYRFVQANDARYAVDVTPVDYSGLLLCGGRGQITEVIVLPDGTEVGNCMFFMDHESGPGYDESHWGFGRIKLPRMMPHLLLDSHRNNNLLLALPSDFRGLDMALEGDFYKYFTLYAPDNYQVDALSVITPDVMSVMMDFCKDYDVEIVDDELYLYGAVLNLSKRSAVEPFLVALHQVGAEISARAASYKDDRSSRAAQTIAPEGRRPKERSAR